MSPNSGPVAQLGARFHGMEEVVGSIPTRSTNLTLCPQSTSCKANRAKDSMSVARNNRRFAWWNTSADRPFQPAGVDLGFLYIKSG